MCNSLYFFHLRSAPPSQKDLETAFSISRATCSALVTKMEQAGLLIRKTAINDGRIRRLVLTKKSNSLVQQINAFFDETEQMVMKILDSKSSIVFEALHQINQQL
ncbi:MarR family winged helix-turn-helix transcriptional regulator [Lactiplantibacillus carotarum]|uniref:MarR family winged helix-turn-helix transcriptional regulator n=1 Tax=Lactiplantibacillus carotarum TaxID=2993456 RepID=UPI00298F12B5|nr:MarR family transcriptional regulator [Lactiplantibacillus carotarum]